MTRRRVAILGLAVLTGAAIAQAIAPFPAHADEATYINDLALLDIPVNAKTLPLGHSICAEVSANGTKGMDTVVLSALSQGVPHRNISGIIVLAVQELCPSNTVALNAWEAQNR